MQRSEHRWTAARRKMLTGPESLRINIFSTRRRYSESSMSTRRYGDFSLERQVRLVRRDWANKRLGIIHQARFSLDHVLLLPLQHDSGTDKGRIALTQREGTPEHARRRLIVAAGHLQLASMLEGGRVLQDYIILQLPGSETVIKR